MMPLGSAGFFEGLLIAFAAFVILYSLDKLQIMKDKIIGLLYMMPFIALMAFGCIKHTGIVQTGLISLGVIAVIIVTGFLFAKGAFMAFGGRRR